MVGSTKGKANLWSAAWSGGGVEGSRPLLVALGTWENAEGAILLAAPKSLMGPGAAHAHAPAGQIRKEKASTS